MAGAKKQQIDKESMYQKIMPSTAKPLRSEPVEGGALTVEPRKPSSSPSPPAVTAMAMPTAAPILPNEGGVVLKGKANSHILINIMEEMVVDKLEAAFSKFNCCKCDRCKKDVAAIALNKLTPKYVVTDPAHTAAYLAQQNSAAVTTAIVQAILVVRAKPRH